MKHGVITGKLVARTAIHIGSGFGDETTDAPLFRDAQGKWLIPGTTQGGVLRTIATRLAPRLGMEPCQSLISGRQQTCKCEVCHLFGNLQPSEEEEYGAEEDRIRASRVWVYNAQPCEEDVKTSIRDGVGIDRSSGTAARAAASKFDLEVIPAGTTFTFRIELEDTNEDDHLLLACALAEWQEERVWLGGNKGRGLGALTLEDIRYSEYDLDASDSLMSFLKSDSPWENAQVQDRWFDAILATVQERVAQSYAQMTGIARNFVSLTLTLQATGPMVTNDITTATWTGFDHAPALRFIQKPGSALLHGSGMRGVLRSQAERIARTLVTQRYEGDDDFQACCPACSPVEPQPEMPLASCDALLNVAGVTPEVEVTDEQLCLACQLFGSTRRGSRLLVEDSPQQGSPEYKIMDFLAIDRFTGGGLDEAKFDALVLWRPKFEVRLHLENAEPWELGWLTLVLRDLAEEYLSVGFGVSKGFGKVTVSNWKVKIGFIAPEDFPGESSLIDGLEISRSGLYHLLECKRGDTEKQERAHALAKSWVKASIDNIDLYRRDEQIYLKADSYFNDDVFPLYEKEVNLNA